MTIWSHLESLGEARDEQEGTRKKSDSSFWKFDIRLQERLDFRQNVRHTTAPDPDLTSRPFVTCNAPIQIVFGHVGGTPAILHKGIVCILEGTGGGGSDTMS